jgi:hypothetical protein
MKQYIFGYGSIINYKSIEQLDRNYKRLIIPVLISDLERQFILTKMNNQYFGVYDKLNSLTNGILLEVNSEELKKVDKREKYYKRELLNNNRINFIYQNFKLSKDDKVYIYYPLYNLTKKTRYIKSEQISNYIKSILIGVVNFDKKFIIHFLEYTKDIKLASLDIL